MHGPADDDTLQLDIVRKNKDSKISIQFEFDLWKERINPDAIIYMKLDLEAWGHGFKEFFGLFGLNEGATSPSILSTVYKTLKPTNDPKKAQGPLLMHAQNQWSLIGWEISLLSTKTNRMTLHDRHAFFRLLQGQSPRLLMWPSHS